MERSVHSSSVLLAAAAVAATFVAPSALGQDRGVTELVSVKTNGVQGNDSSLDLAISPDGKLVAFSSNATNFVKGDRNGSTDLFLRDRVAGTTELLSVSLSGTTGQGISRYPFFSADARLVVFMSTADDLVAGDTNAKYDVFVRDRTTQTTEIVSVDGQGNGVDGWSNGGVISRDGSLVAFVSDATTLVAGDTNGVKDVFVRDRILGTTERISVDSSGVEGNDSSFTQSQGISADGRFVLFESRATNLVANDTNGFDDVFVHDRTTGITERVSVDSSGGEADHECWDAVMSLDGRYVAFRSLASNLVANDTNGTYDLFLHDRTTGTTERISVDSYGTEADGESVLPWFTADGQRVLFASGADNLVPGDVNQDNDIFVRDLALGTTTLREIDWIQGLGEGGVGTYAMSDDGSVVGFYSTLDKLVAGDTNHLQDDFVHEVHPASWSNYGAGFPGTHGVPDLSSDANPVLGTSIDVSLANSFGSPTVGLLFVGFAQADFATNRGGDLLVAPAFTLPISFSYGGDSFPFAVPDDPALLDFHLDLQGLEADAGAVKGVSFSAGLELVLGK